MNTKCKPRIYLKRIFFENFNFWSEFTPINIYKNIIPLFFEYYVLYFLSCLQQQNNYAIFRNEDDDSHLLFTTGY